MRWIHIIPCAALAAMLAGCDGMAVEPLPDEVGTPSFKVTTVPPWVETWDPRMRKWLLLFEKHANHDGRRSGLLLDDSCGSMNEAGFRKRLERTLREARAAGFDAKVWGYAPGEAPRWLDDLNRIPVAPDE